MFYSDTAGAPLSGLKPGETATVQAVSTALPAHERRRVMDLGILPGAEIEVVMRSAGGDPTAYRVRGALIALRNEQSQWILVSRNPGEGAK